MATDEEYATFLENANRHLSQRQEDLQRVATEEEYMAFLEKADQNLVDAQAYAQAQRDAAAGKPNGVFKATDAGARAPRVIREACEGAVYVSDADEPFREVSLRWDGEGLPDEEGFARLIGHRDPDSADITIMDPLDWDTQGRYAKLIEAVREATGGNDVRAYRVVRDETRSEHWLVSRGDDGRIVGVKALGVES